MIVDRPGSHFIFVLPFDHVHRGYKLHQSERRSPDQQGISGELGKMAVFGQREEMENWRRSSILSSRTEEYLA